MYHLCLFDSNVILKRERRPSPPRTSIGLPKSPPPSPPSAIPLRRSPDDGVDAPQALAGGRRGSAGGGRFGEARTRLRRRNLRPLPFRPCSRPRAGQKVVRGVAFLLFFGFVDVVSDFMVVFGRFDLFVGLWYLLDLVRWIGEGMRKPICRCWMLLELYLMNELCYDIEEKPNICCFACSWIECIEYFLNYLLVICSNLTWLQKHRQVFFIQHFVLMRYIAANEKSVLNFSLFFGLLDRF